MVKLDRLGDHRETTTTTLILLHPAAPTHIENPIAAAGTIPSTTKNPALAATAVRRIDIQTAIADTNPTDVIQEDAGEKTTDMMTGGTAGASPVATMVTRQIKDIDAMIASVNVTATTGTEIEIGIGTGADTIRSVTATGTETGTTTETETATIAETERARRKASRWTTLAIFTNKAKSTTRRSRLW